jgi:hypothetical protein
MGPPPAGRPASAIWKLPRPRPSSVRRRKFAAAAIGNQRVTPQDSLRRRVASGNLSVPRAQAHLLVSGKEVFEANASLSNSPRDFENGGAEKSSSSESDGARTVRPGTEELASVSASEGSSTDSEDCSDDPSDERIGTLDLQKLLSDHRAALTARGLTRRGRVYAERSRRGIRQASSRSQRSEARAHKNAMDSDEDDDDEEKSISEVWIDYLVSVPASFCDYNSLDASMRVSQERLVRGEVSYRGLHVSHENNEDLLFIFKHKFEAKSVRGQSLSSYEQLRACAGQFLRFSVVCGLVPLSRGCDSGRLFYSVLSMDVVQTFLAYFQLRCSASTVLAKAFHLRTISRYAERFYSSVAMDDGNKARAALMTDYLTSACSAEKCEARRGTARMRSEERRIETGKMILGEDFKRFGKVAEDCLRSIIRSGERGIQQNSKLRSKWCIAFVGFLVFNGGGQRPQVYAQLQEPENLDEAVRRWKEDDRVTVAAMLEKRPRQTGYSRVSFPGRSLAIFEFHLRTVKPAIRAAVSSTETETERRAKWQRERGEDVDNPLLLDTRTGEGYMTPQVRSTLTRFMQGIDPELVDISPSSVRSSYATWKYNEHRQGRFFADLEEEEFLETLARIMNTSVEQLKATYISCGEMDSTYDQVMSEVHRPSDGSYTDDDERN